MPDEAWTRRRLLGFAGLSLVGGLAGCATTSDGSDRKTAATRTRTSTATTAAESTSTGESSKQTPGYKEYHWHGRLFFEVDGTLVDFDRPKYYLDNLQSERPETVYFHFHDSAHGPNEWSNEKKVVTFARALNLLPDIEYSQDEDGKHVVTYDGTTYRAADSGVNVGVYEGTRRIDPTNYEVQHNDNFWVRIDTGKTTSTPSGDSPRTGKLIVDVNNRRLNFESSGYVEAGTERFQFRDDDAPYTWFSEGDPITVAAALDTLPPITYSTTSESDHVIEYDVDGEFGGTYRSSRDGTEIIVRQRTTNLDPKQHELQHGDIVWVYLHTDRAPENEH